MCVLCLLLAAHWLGVQQLACAAAVILLLTELSGNSRPLFQVGMYRMSVVEPFRCTAETPVNPEK